MVIADWFSETAGHWCMPEWWLREQAILTSFSYQAVASFLTIAVPLLGPPLAIYCHPSKFSPEEGRY